MSTGQVTRRRWVRVGYVPVVGLGAVGALTLVGASTLSVVWLVVVVGGVIAASFIAERLAPYEPAWNRARGDGPRDLAHAVVNEATLVVSLVALSWLGLTDQHWWPLGVPFVVQVFFGIVVLDAGITLVHVASHHRSWLWRFHAVHHSVGRFYGLNGLTKHPVHQMIEAGAGMAPLLLLGVPHRVAATLAALVVVQLLLQHGNVDVSLGAAGRWLALGPGHRLHHLRYAGEGDVNFGLFTLVWDRALGTYRDPSSNDVRDGDLGVAGRPDYPATYIAQLAAPMRAS